MFTEIAAKRPETALAHEGRPSARTLSDCVSILPAPLCFSQALLIPFPSPDKYCVFRNVGR